MRIFRTRQSMVYIYQMCFTKFLRELQVNALMRKLRLRRPWDSLPVTERQVEKLVHAPIQAGGGTSCWYQVQQQQVLNKCGSPTPVSSTTHPRAWCRPWHAVGA